MTARLTVVMAPDSFKGTATAVDAAAALAVGWHAVRPSDEVMLAPMADGGEGTIDTIAAAVPGARRMPERVQGPVGRGHDGLVDAEWLLLPGTWPGEGPTGVVELAAASGITHLDPLAPMAAHTRGFGQLIERALEAGVDRLLLAIGGSASTDGGTGALAALGARFLDDAGVEVRPGGAGLRDIERADLSALLPLPAGGAVVLGDVTNPLLGEKGAAAVFGPQKGATPAQMAELDAGLRRLSGVLSVDPETPGAGAAGGTGFALLAWGAAMTPGAAAVADAIGLADSIRSADVVITGEGRFDDQSSGGKVPSRVLALADTGGAAAMLVAGRIDADTHGFAASVSLSDLAGGTDAALADPLRWLRAAGELLAGAL
ncbi:glycerate kinase [Marisediminicola antarctica]|uniref:Glycerate kinase n=1 Tax=Marisediminicola antarctica TaxID=674079 RepID=A0A7L5AFC8_9MICO|nr:glycerate kinase [Marisediminicola antarctica]QHO68355.1 glycerate kinase [Marisediminicola antarctica]